MEGLRKRLLASALAYYQEFIEQRRSDPAAQAELRDTTRRVETILADLAVLRAAGELYLLAQPSAHDDLRLDEGQRAKVADLSDRAGRRWIEAFGDPAHLRPPVERVRLALEQARANEAEVDAILTPSQRVRLRQIALQSEGPAAFREPEVVEALGLTPGQRERIRAIEEELLLRPDARDAIGQSRRRRRQAGDGTHPGRARRRPGAALEGDGRGADPRPAEPLPRTVPAAARPEADDLADRAVAGRTVERIAGPPKKSASGARHEASDRISTHRGASSAARSRRHPSRRGTPAIPAAIPRLTPSEVTPCVDESSP